MEIYFNKYNIGKLMEDIKDIKNKNKELKEEKRRIKRKIEITYAKEDERIRLDKFLSFVLHEKYNIEITRNIIQDKILKGEILVFENNKNKKNKKIKPSYILKTNDKIIYIEYEEKEKVIPEKLKNCVYSSIIYEDEDIIVINKPKGIIVHSGSNTSITLVDILKEKYTLYGEKGREGIVHRLDKNTSGLMIVAKTKMAYENLINTFKKREIIKKYRGIVFGIVAEKEGIIDMPIGRDLKNRHKMKVRNDGKNAKTKFKVITYIENEYTYLDMQIYTGRTHQIRVHMAKIGHPLVGDDIYTRKQNKWKIQGQVLQSYYLEFPHPLTNEKMKFEIEENEEIRKIIGKE